MIQLVFQKYNISNLPLLFPIRVVVPAGATRIISFPDEFLGRAVALLVQNNDAANAAQYQYGGDALDFQNLAASSFRSIDGTIIDRLAIIAGAGGTVLVEAQVLPIERAEIPQVQSS